jgi:transposase
LDSRVVSEFLAGLSREIKPRRHIILFVDGASWHSGEEVEVPSNITLYFFPPYSPELNPIERLWNYLKSNFLSRKIFGDIENIFDVGTQAWHELSCSIIKSVCHTQLIC